MYCGPNDLNNLLEGKSVVESNLGRCYSDCHIFDLRPGPANGLSRSSHTGTPSQAQIFFVFWNNPADLATIPHSNLQHK